MGKTQQALDALADHMSREVIALVEDYITPEVREIAIRNEPERVMIRLRDAAAATVVEIVYQANEAGDTRPVVTVDNREAVDA